jgi:hypothetical protein
MLVYFNDTWSILRTFGLPILWTFDLFYGHLVYFTDIWSFYGQLVYFTDIWSIVWTFGTFSVLVRWTTKIWQPWSETPETPDSRIPNFPIRAATETFPFRHHLERRGTFGDFLLSVFTQPQPTVVREGRNLHQPKSGQPIFINQPLDSGKRGERVPIRKKLIFERFSSRNELIFERFSIRNKLMFERFQSGKT